jgi:hypothetical protein
LRSGCISVAQNSRWLEDFPFVRHIPERVYYSTEHSG